jgi:hypothetical protein
MFFLQKRLCIFLSRFKFLIRFLPEIGRMSEKNDTVFLAVFPRHRHFTQEPAPPKDRKKYCRMNLEKLIYLNKPEQCWDIRLPRNLA